VTTLTSLQVKLLRLLESRTYRKVGETKTKQANFRLVCATNRDLSQMMESGQFRQDLFYRISTFPVRLPPLRERREDIALLARSILLRIAPDQKITLTKEGSDTLSRYDFPGNIREMINLLERARIRAGGTKLNSSHFSDLSTTPTNSTENDQEEHPIWNQNDKIISFSELEHRYLSHLLKTFPGTQAELAAQLGMSHRTLTRKISSAVGKKRYKNI
jgi:two-component system, NtrC family, response regulator HydG